jgi:hypothetical protein
LLETDRLSEAYVLPPAAFPQKGTAMRRITEFKGYKSMIEFDPAAGEFVTRTLPGEKQKLSLDDSFAQWERIVPFPEPVSKSLKPRLVG